MDMRTKAQELVKANELAGATWLDARQVVEDAPAIAQAYLESVQVFESIQRVLESEDWSDNEVLATVDLIVREFLNKVSKE